MLDLVFIRPMDGPTSSEPYEGLVNLSDQFVRLIVTYDVHQVAAYLWGEGQFAIAKSTGPAPACQETAWLAVGAAPTRLAGRATALINIGTFVQDGDAEPTFFAQFQGGENAGRPSSDDDDIIVTL
jgi:hypothetical protein